VVAIAAQREAIPVALPWIATAIGIIGQTAYPLANRHVRTDLTDITVTAFFVAVAAALCRVPRGVIALGISCVFAWAVELLGARTGFPFGHYEYGSALQPQLAGVPVIVPLAWTAMAIAALTVARRLARSRLLVAIVGGVALAAWDVFLDPQMVAAGYWHWQSPQWTFEGIPVSNFAGWLVVAVVLITVLDRVLPPTGGSTAAAVAATIYLWTYASELLAGFAFFHRPVVAVVAGLAMGGCAIPYALTLRRTR
jgi:putative membrane protein